jgi:hypothetical protein
LAIRYFYIINIYINIINIEGKKINLEYVNDSDILYAMEKGFSLYSLNIDNEKNTQLEKDKDKEKDKERYLKGNINN